MARYRAERLAALGFILFAVYVGGLALEFPAGGGIFPLFAAGGAVFLSVMIVVDTVFRRRPGSERPVDLNLSFDRLKPLLLTVLAVAYVLAIFEIGYFAASLLFLVAATLMIGIRSARVIALTAAVLFPLMYVFFETFLQANLPQGLLL